MRLRISAPRALVSSIRHHARSALARFEPLIASVELRLDEAAASCRGSVRMADGRGFRVEQVGLDPGEAATTAIDRIARRLVRDRDVERLVGSPGERLRQDSTPATVLRRGPPRARG